MPPPAPSRWNLGRGAEQMEPGPQHGDAGGAGWAQGLPGRGSHAPRGIHVFSCCGGDIYFIRNRSGGVIALRLSCALAACSLRVCVLVAAKVTARVNRRVGRPWRSSARVTRGSAVAFRQALSPLPAVTTQTAPDVAPRPWGRGPSRPSEGTASQWQVSPERVSCASW